MVFVMGGGRVNIGSPPEAMDPRRAAFSDERAPGASSGAVRSARRAQRCSPT